MNAADIIIQLKALEPDLRSAGVERLYLFGSRARGDNRSDSDVDLLFDARRNDFSYFDLFRIRDDLAAKLGLAVDLIEQRGLHALVRPHVEPDLVQVF